MNIETSQEPNPQKTGIQQLETKSGILVDVARRLMEQARSGSPATLARVGEVLDKGLQALLRPSTLYGFQVSPVRLGTAVRFTIPEGQRALDIIAEIEKLNPRAGSDRVISRDGPLLGDSGLNETAEKEYESALIICKGTKEVSRPDQVNFLRAHEMIPAPRWMVTLAAALYRDKFGFPEQREDIGTSRDRGDLLGGAVLRTDTGDLRSCAFGLDTALGHYDGRSVGPIIIAGVRSLSAGGPIQLDLNKSRQSSFSEEHPG